MPYRPTPDALDRDARTLLLVLAIALRNMDRLHIARGEEETSTGTCWLPEQEHLPNGRP
jgi:hypothetical protein